jgi:endonuclease/exonuclease/phosphatase family metal-dependent hydrolase
VIEALTYNVEYGKRLPEIYEWLKSLPEKPDLICLQEFPEQEIDSFNRLNLFTIPGHAYAPALTKYGRMHGELTAFDEAKLTPKKSMVVDLGEGLLERIYRRGSPSHRSALVTTFEHEGGEITFVNPHLIMMALHSGRRNQLDKILQLIGESPAVILGDFNYSNLIGGEGLARFMEQRGFTQAGERLITHLIRGKAHQLDYLFFRGCSVEDVRTMAVSYSDHFPVFAKILNLPN